MIIIMIIIIIIIIIFLSLFLLLYFVIKFIFIHYVDNILSVIYNNNINNNKAFSKWPTFHIILLNHVLLGFLYWGMVKEFWWTGIGLFNTFLFFILFSFAISQQHLLLLCSPLYMYKFYIQPCHVRENWKSLKFILLLLDFFPLLLHHFFFYYVCC